MNRGPSLYGLLRELALVTIDAATCVTLIAWEHAHRARVNLMSR